MKIDYNSNTTLQFLLDKSILQKMRDEENLKNIERNNKILRDILFYFRLKYQETKIRIFCLMFLVALKK